MLRPSFFHGRWRLPILVFWADAALRVGTLWKLQGEVAVLAPRKQGFAPRRGGETVPGISQMGMEMEMETETEI